jgi:hypothetical protein
MDYRLWFAGIGVASVLAMWGFHCAGRKNANAHLLSRGVPVEGEVVESVVRGSRFTWTEVTYKYAPEGVDAAIIVTRKLDGRVSFRPGQRVAVRYLASHPSVSLLVGQEGLHDAS